MRRVRPTARPSSAPYWSAAPISLRRAPRLVCQGRARCVRRRRRTGGADASASATPPPVRRRLPGRGSGAGPRSRRVSPAPVRARAVRATAPAPAPSPVPGSSGPRPLRSPRPAAVRPPGRSEAGRDRCDARSAGVRRGNRPPPTPGRRASSGAAGPVPHARPKGAAGLRPRRGYPKESVGEPAPAPWPGSLTGRRQAGSHLLRRDGFGFPLEPPDALPQLG